MAKGQTQSSTDISKQIATDAPARINPIVQQTQTQQDLNQQQANQSYGSAYGVYQRGADTGFYDPTQLATIRQNAANVTATGGYDPTQLASIRSDLGDLQKTGGYDPAQLQKLQGYVDQFTQTGGYDPAVLDKITSGYSQFADTGGFTPEQEQAFKREATAGVGSIYDTLARQALINRSATGGLGTGGDISQMARQLSQEESKAATGAEVALSEEERAGKLAGLGGLSSTQRDVAGLKQGALGIGTGLASGVAGGVRDIAGQRVGLESGVATGTRQGVAQQANIEQSVAEGVKNAGQGFTQLFDTNTNQVTQMGKQVLDLLGLSYSSQSQAASILAQLSKNPGLFQTAIGDITALAGAASGVMGALP